MAAEGVASAPKVTATSAPRVRAAAISPATGCWLPASRRSSASPLAQWKRSSGVKPLA